MKEKNDKKEGSKKLKSSLKAASASALLAGALLVSSPGSAAGDGDRAATIRERVKTVKAQLQKKVAGETSANPKLSYSETELAQWGNWGNWANWNNWRNWNNWNNWANWGNWHNR
jgi:hypothetical protein